MYCKNCGNAMDPNAAICVKCGFAKNTGNTYCANCGQPVMPGATVCTACGVAVQGSAVPNPDAKSKLGAGLLGIFLGAFGVHNFYLGYTGKGVAQLLLTLIGGMLTCGVAAVAVEIWALIEGIQILCGNVKTDASGMPLSD